MVRVVSQFFIELIRRYADLVEIAAISKLNTARHHVDVQALHIIIRDVRTRICDDRKRLGESVRGTLLTVHVICFLAAKFAELSRKPEYSVRFVDMNMNFRLALAAGENHRVAELCQRLAKFATIYVGRSHQALGTESKLRCVIGFKEFDRCLDCLQQCGIGHRRHPAVT